MAAAPSAPVGVPGLERLMQLATVNLHETESGYHGNNYTVLSEEEALFTMNEDIPPGFLRMSSSNRTIIFDGMENTGIEVFRFQRQAGSNLNKIELFLYDQLACVIRIERTCRTQRPLFSITDPQEQPVIRLKGKRIEVPLFQLQTMDKAPIGSVHKLWRGWKKMLFCQESHKNDLIINFPADLALQYKLGVIVACVFIDFRFFEQK